MTAQGVMSSPTPKLGSMLAGLSTPDVSAKGTNGASFEDFMTTSKESKVQEATPKITGRKTKETAEPTDVKERAKDFFTGESKVKEAESAAPVESVKEFEETAEAVSALMVQVQQVICNELGISEEEFNEALNELGMSAEDLLDRTNLQEFFLQVQDVAEPTELLTNEELFGSFAELMQAVEQTLQEAGVTSEEVQTVLREAELMTKEPEAEPEEVAEHAELPDEISKAETKTGEVQTETTEEPTETQTAVTRNEAQSETQAGTQKESDNADEKHTVSARAEGKDKVISSEADVNVRNMFIDTLTNVAAGTGEEAVEAAAQLRDIANQIMEQIKIVIKPDQTNMELQLNPEHLGRVNLTITEKEGMMTAQFTTQSEVAKEAIESQMATLRETLQNQGIKVESIEVTVSEFGFERDRDARQSEEGESGRQKRRSGFRMEETEEGAPQMTDYINVTDSSVDYSA